MAVAARDVYAQSRFETSSPGRLVVMLYDGALRDVDRATNAFEQGDAGTAHERLLHAQEIVLELLSALDTTSWAGGAGLANVYVFLVRELMRANVERDVSVLTTCRTMLEELRGAWEAALAGQQTRPAVSGSVA